MKPIKITQVQKILNLCHTKKDFTYDLKPKENTGIYIVSVKSLYFGENPSLDFELNLKISEVINKTVIISKYFDSIGGWTDENNNFCINANVHFHNKALAIDTAKAFSQKAIFDKKNNKVINIKY